METYNNNKCLIKQHYFQYIIWGIPVTQKEFQMWINTAIKNKWHKNHSISNLCADDTCNLKKRAMHMKKKNYFAKKIVSNIEQFNYWEIIYSK